MANIEPRQWRIGELIRLVRQGEIRVPRFQRGFVWRQSQVLELLRSVRKRYPIGTMFVWRTPDRYSSFDRVGAVSVPLGAPQQPSTVGYVLDGHQRISCLVGTLGMTEDEALSLRGADRIFLVHYDLMKRDFVHVRIPEDHHLPIRYLLANETRGQEDPLTDWVDERRDRTEAGTAERRTWDAYRRDIAELQQSLGAFILRYDDVKDASLSEAIDIFRLVNQQGTPARAEEVFAALTWTPDGFDFVREAQRALEPYPAFESLGPSVFLRALMGSLGYSAYERDWQAVQEKERSRLSEAALRVQAAMSLAMAFVGEQGARHARVLPYALQMVLLARFFEICSSPHPAQVDELRRWFWATSYGAVYGGAGSLQLDLHLERATKLANGEQLSVLPERPRLQPLPKRYHPRSARVRAWHLFLASLDPLDPTTGEPVVAPLSRGQTDVRSVLRGDDAWVLGSRFLLGPAKGQPRNLLLRARARTDYLTVLASHAISDDALLLLERGRNEEFLSARRQVMEDLERAHAAQFVELPSDPDPIDEPEIDLDESGDSAP